MNLNGINLVEYNNRYMLVDYSASKPIIISKRVYIILSKVKKGIPIDILKGEYGENLVNTIESTINDLKVRKVIECSDKSFYEEGKKEICKYQEQDIDLLEGNMMISQDSNMACTYCYGGASGTYNQKGLMSIEMAEKYFRYFISSGGKRKFQKLVFFGGEPLLNMQVIRHIVLTWERIKHLHIGREMYFTLTTNGLLIEPEIVEFFRDYNVGISISLDGPKEIHNANRILSDGSPTFDKVMQAIEIMRKYELPISIRSTVTKNVDFNKLYDFFEEQDFDVHTVTIADYPMVYPQRKYQFDLNTYNKFLSKQREIVNKGCEDILQGKKNSFKAKQMSVSFHKPKTSDYSFLCGAGNWFVAFGLDGYIYPCNRIVGHEKFRIGDIETGINKDKMEKLLIEFLAVSESCNSCWASSRCKGRCIHQKLNEEKVLEEVPVELCNIYRESIADSLFFSHKIKKYMNKEKKGFDEALIRYNANHMMENLKNEV